MASQRMTFGPDDFDEVARVREALVTRFEQWTVDRLDPVKRDQIAPEDLGLLLDWKHGYGDGRLDVWRREDLDEFLLGWCPRKLTATPADAQYVPASIAQSLVFLADQGLLARGSDSVDELTAYAEAVTDEYMDRMADPANFGMAKSIFGSLGIEDASDLTQEDLDRAIEGFNALPEEVRRAVTGSAQFGEPEPVPSLGSVRLPAAEAVRQSAAAAPVLAAFGKLADYFASPGKQLTQQGNIRLADARALVELLGTGESLEQQIGHRTYRTGSATQLAQLDHWQWWAHEVGAIRDRGNKLVGVKAWQKRKSGDPVSEARKAFEVLSTYGPLSSYYTWLAWETHDVMDEMHAPILGRLLQADEPVGYVDLLADIQQVLEDATISEGYPGEFGVVLDRLLTLLERAGVITQADVVRAPTEYGGSRREGGTITITPFGVVMAVDEVRRQGAHVEVIPSPESLTAAQLTTAAADEDTDPETWWAMVADWVDAQDDTPAAAGELVEALGNSGSSGALLTLILAPTPPKHVPLLDPLMRERVASDPPPHELGSVALTWLLTNGRVSPDEVPPDQLVDAGLAAFGILAEDDPALIPGVMGEDRDQAQQLDLIAAAGSRMPPRVVPLLDAIGQHHTDKVVSKAARKELFRVRSRLASQGAPSMS